MCLVASRLSSSLVLLSPQKKGRRDSRATTPVLGVGVGEIPRPAVYGLYIRVYIGECAYLISRISSALVRAPRPPASEQQPPQTADSCKTFSVIFATIWRARTQITNQRYRKSTSSNIEIEITPETGANRELHAAVGGTWTWGELGIFSLFRQYDATSLKALS